MEQPDKVFCRDIKGELVDFSTKAAWESLRPHAHVVGWCDVVWFSRCIPRHTFILWLFIGENLKTQDKMKAWELRANQGPLLCSLCKIQQDTHAQLYFKCKFSKQVWNKIKGFIMIPGIGDSWRDIVQHVGMFAYRKVARVFVFKIIFAATVYYIWQERNARLFKGEARNPDKLFNVIYGTVRLKLMSVKFKDSHHVRNKKMAWHI